MHIPAADLTDAENRHLRLVDDDGRRQQAAAYPVIRDRECSAAHVLRGKLARARGSHQLPEALRDPNKSNDCARWITGTMSPSSPSAVPTPMLISA